jgi:hypothetical protein
MQRINGSCVRVVTGVVRDRIMGRVRPPRARPAFRGPVGTGSVGRGSAGLRYIPYCNGRAGVVSRLAGPYAFCQVSRLGLRSS